MIHVVQLVTTQDLQSKCECKWLLLVCVLNALTLPQGE